jgi:phage FluMu protein Com
MYDDNVESTCPICKKTNLFIRDQRDLAKGMKSDFCKHFSIESPGVTEAKFVCPFCNEISTLKIVEDGVVMGEHSGCEHWGRLASFRRGNEVVVLNRPL